LPFETDRFKELTGILNSATGICITFQVMAITGQSTGDHHAVGAVFEGTQDVDEIHPPGAKNFDDLDRWRVLYAKAASEISGVVGAMAATKGNDVGLKFRHT
jgi:hypothetical protein